MHISPSLAASYSVIIVWCCLQGFDSDSKRDAAATAPVTEEASRNSDLQSTEHCEKQTSKPDKQGSAVLTEESCRNNAHGNHTYLI